MGRARLLINKEELTSIIEQAEQERSFENQSKLFEYVSKLPWAQNIKDSAGKVRSLNAANIASRVTEFGIQLKTAKGKMGRAKGSKNRSEESPTGEIPTAFAQQLVTLKKEFPSHVDLISKMADSNKRVALLAATKVMCIHCSGTLALAKTCNVKSCPLYYISPIEKGRKDEEVE